MAGTLLAMLILKSLATLCSGEDRVYKLLYQGGTMIDAPYVDYGTIPKMRCGAICNGIPECWVYTWDKMSSRCRILAPLTDMVTNTSADTALNTYVAYSIGGKSIHLTSSLSTWDNGKAECENMGGQLAIPRDTTHALLLHLVLQVSDGFYIGIHRLPTNLQEWLNEEGEVVTDLLPWFPGEPNNSGGYQYYLCSWKGYISDVGDTYSLKAICEI